MDLIFQQYKLLADIPQAGDKFHEFKGPSKKDLKRNYRSLLNHLIKEGTLRYEENFTNEINIKGSSRTFSLLQGLVENYFVDKGTDALHMITIAAPRLDTILASIQEVVYLKQYYKEESTLRLLDPAEFIRIYSMQQLGLLCESQ